MANALSRAAQATFAFNKSVLRLKSSQAVEQNLAPSLAATIPNLLRNAGKSFAVLYSGFSCQPPITDPLQLRSALEDALKKTD